MTAQKGVKSATEATVTALQEIDQPLPEDRLASHYESGRPDLFAESGTTTTSRQLVIAPGTKAEEPSADQGDYRDFNWSDEDAVVLRRQLAVAAYRTPDGGLVIRQERDWNDEDDMCIVISPENVGDFVRRRSQSASAPGETTLMGKRNDRERSPRHVRLYHYMMNSPAWHDINAIARAIYIEIAKRYAGVGSNNGRIPYSVREAAAELKIGTATASRALAALVDHGFIVPVTKGAFSRKIRHATEWRLTEFPCDVTNTPMGTKDYMRWQPPTAGNDQRKQLSIARRLRQSARSAAYPLAN